MKISILCQKFNDHWPKHAYTSMTLSSIITLNVHLHTHVVYIDTN